MQGVGPAKRAVFLKLQLLGGLPFILSAGIVSLLTIGTTQCNDISHVNPLTQINWISPC